MAQQSYTHTQTVLVIVLSHYAKVTQRRRSLKSMTHRDIVYAAVAWLCTNSVCGTTKKPVNTSISCHRWTTRASALSHAHCVVHIGER